MVRGGLCDWPVSRLPGPASNHGIRELLAMNSLVKRGASGTFDLRGRDVYGRLVGRLLINGRDVGASLVQRGAVFAWDGSLGQCDQLDYAEFETSAQWKRFGVWSVNGGLRRPLDEMEALGGGEP